jgi:hypothetical protein
MRNRRRSTEAYDYYPGYAPSEPIEPIEPEETYQQEIAPVEGSEQFGPYEPTGEMGEFAHDDAQMQQTEYADAESQVPQEQAYEDDNLPAPMATAAPLAQPVGSEQPSPIGQAEGEEVEFEDFSDNDSGIENTESETVEPEGQSQSSEEGEPKTTKEDDEEAVDWQ